MGFFSEPVLRTSSITFPSSFSFFSSPSSTAHPPTPPPQGRELDVNVEAATAHTGKWMRGEGMSGLASDGSQVLVSIFGLFRLFSGPCFTVKKVGNANAHEMEATQGRFFVHSAPGVHGGDW